MTIYTWCWIAALAIAWGSVCYVLGIAHGIRAEQDRQDRRLQRERLLRAMERHPAGRNP